MSPICHLQKGAAQFVQAHRFKTNTLLMRLSQNDHDLRVKSFARALERAKTAFHAPKTFNPLQHEIVTHIEKITFQKLLPSQSKVKKMMTIEEFRSHFYPQISKEKFIVSRLNSQKDVPTGFTKDSESLVEVFCNQTLDPARAIERYIEGPTLSDSGTCVEAVFYKALKDLLGQKRFNLVFSHKEFEIRIGQKGTIDEKSQLIFFTKHLFEKTKGMRCFFSGIPFYQAKHQGLEGMGVHAIYVADDDKKKPLYWTMGFDHLLTENEIQTHLLEIYNRPSTHACPNDGLNVSLLKIADAQRLDKEKKAGYPFISKEKADALGLGFSGYQHTDMICCEIVDFINKQSFDDLAHADFPKRLMQEQLEQMIISLLDFDDYSVTNNL